MTRVSVPIATYNRAEMVEGAIEGALGQTYDDIEIVVVDDASTDETLSVLSKYDTEDDVRVFRNETNHGISYTKNRAAGNAEGKYLAFLDDDDRWHPEKIERQVEAMERLGPDYCGVYTGATVRDGREGPISEYEHEEKAGDVYPEILLNDCIIPFSSVMVRREDFEAVGGFDEAFPRAVDWDLFIRMAKCHRFGYLSNQLTEIIDHDGGVSSEATHDIEARQLIWDKYRAEFREHPEIRRQFKGYWARRRAFQALRSDERVVAATSFIDAARLQRNPRDIARSLLSLFGERGFNTAARVLGWG